MEKVDIRIKHNKTNFKIEVKTHALQRLKRIIKELHTTYLFVPADKTTKNIQSVESKYTWSSKLNSQFQQFQATNLKEEQIVGEH